MILIVCVDDHMGMTFHNRRQSRDRVQLARMLELIGQARLYVNDYSVGLLAEYTVPDLRVTANPMEEAGAGDYCFVENLDVTPYADRIEQLILYRWNRRYPGDLFLTLPLQERWRLTSSYEFAGSSHPSITEEIYTYEKV